MLRIPTVLTLAATLSVGGATTGAQDLSAFDGRTITYSVGTKAGGGYDRYARLIAPYLERHLPGATVVVMNEPAGNGTAVLRGLSRDDGPVEEIVTFNTGFVIGQATGATDFPHDFRDFNFIGKASSEARYLIVRAGAGLGTLSALQTASETLTCLSSSAKGASHAQTRALIDAFDLNARLIPGFMGAEGEAALAKGEADCLLTSESNLSPMLDADLIEIVGRIGTPTDSRFAGVSNLADLAAAGAQADAVAFVAAMTELGRLTVAAPDADADDVAALRAAYAAALADPELLADAEQRNITIDAATGSEVQALIESLLAPRAASN